MVAPARAIRTSAITTVPPEIDAVISDAVRDFAERRGWGEAGYDIHYHDEPIWFVRHDSDVGPNDVVRVTRVQVAPFATEQGIRIVFIPDAYKYSFRLRRVKAKAAESERASGRQEIAAYELSILLNTDEPAARTRLQDLLEAAWSAAESINLRHMP